CVLVNACIWTESSKLITLGESAWICVDANSCKSVEFRTFIWVACMTATCVVANASISSVVSAEKVVVVRFWTCVVVSDEIIDIFTHSCAGQLPLQSHTGLAKARAAELQEMC